MAGQRLRQQVPPQPPPALCHRLGQRRRQAAFPCRPEQADNPALDAGAPGLRRRIVQPLAQIRRRGAVVSVHQQAEGLRQLRLRCPGRRPGFHGHPNLRTGRSDRLRTAGRQQEQPVDQRFQGVGAGPAHRLAQAQRLPMRRLRLQRRPEADRKAPARALVSVHGGAEGDPGASPAAAPAGGPAESPRLRPPAALPPAAVGPTVPAPAGSGFPHRRR